MRSDDHRDLLRKFARYAGVAPSVVDAYFAEARCARLRGRVLSVYDPGDETDVVKRGDSLTVLAAWPILDRDGPTGDLGVRVQLPSGAQWTRVVERSPARIADCLALSWPSDSPPRRPVVAIEQWRIGDLCTCVDGDGEVLRVSEVVWQTDPDEYGAGCVLLRRHSDDVHWGRKSTHMLTRVAADEVTP